MGRGYVEQKSKMPPLPPSLLHSPLPLSMGGTCENDDITPMIMLYDKDEEIFEDVIRFDFEVIKKEIILNKPDLTKQTL